MFHRAGRSSRKPHGFTLIEVMVSIAVIAIMAFMAARGIDAMLRVQRGALGEGTEGGVGADLDQMRIFQLALAQWQVDLDHMVDVPGVRHLAVDGPAIRLTRMQRDSNDKMLVIAWSVRPSADGRTLQWSRWESRPVSTRTDWAMQWDLAQAWARQDSLPGVREEGRRTAAVDGVELLVHLGDGWVPLDRSNEDRQPNAVRLVLALRQPAVAAGPVTYDWLRPAFPRGGA